MTELECQQTYQELVALLQELHLGWLVEQVEAQIQAGEIAEDSSVAQPEGSTSQAVLIKPEILTAQTKLLLLIDTVERIVVDSIEIEGALVDFLAEESNRLQAPVTLSFESDNPPPLTPSDAGLEDRRSTIAELRQILQALRQEASPGGN